MRPSIFAIALAASGAPSALAFTSQNALSRQHATRLLVGSETTPSATKPIEEGSHDELMYALGINLARQLGDIRPLVENSEELTQVARGLLDAVVGKADEMTQREILQRRGDELSATIIERATKVQKKLEETGKAMLKEMSENPEVAALESGVLIHPLEAGPDGFGKGTRPTAASTVKVHYHGTLPDGTVFDSSLGKDPVTIPLGGVIKGWRVGLQHMCEGETAMLGIPPEMGYGDAGTPDGRIPGGAALFFKIQLIEVLSAGIGGGPKLVGADGNELKANKSGSGLLGVDGKPL
ncbi:hypothetical protein ACHAWO_008354 [Cyclotella atomus]|uniref:peptidylprolyl isomerase n=1 Tax=Cyclotella atomus TaxID=382360 RepID=A0ABD3NB97_9STRA